jgi:uncharacterized protein with NRDE domain
MQGAQQTLASFFPSMCTIAMLLEVVVGAPLVVAANRDEMYARPTRPPESLGDGIAGGVDELSGGTWLAIHRSGRFAAVTNQRALTPPAPGARSRGLAVRELIAADDPDRYVAALDPMQYASMNLVWGDARGASIAYLRRDVRREDALDIERLSPGIHVLCNDRLGAEGFPRGVRLHEAIARAAASDGWPAIVPALQAALADHTREAPTLPTRLPPEIARELTATCIHAPGYGTRSSTIFAAAPGAVLAYLHADGPPCTTPFTDRSTLL